MAISEGLEDKKKLSLKKHVGAVHSAAEFTLLQRKIANALLYNAYDQLNMKETHEIRISFLCELAGYNSRDLKTIKASLIKLISTVIEWNLIDKERNTGTWNASSIISDAQIEGPVCRYSYSRMMRELLHNPLMYAVIDLKTQAHFRSSYGLALYENCIRFEKIPGEPQTPWISMQDFRRLMGIPDAKYKKFNDFKKRVITIAVNEVNEVSPINVAVEYRHAAGEVEAIKFHIEKKKVALEKEDVSQAIQLPVQQEESMDPLSQDLQASFGLTKNAVKKLIEKHGKEQVIAKSKLVAGSASFKAGKITNKAGYLTRALEEDYREAPAVDDQTITVKTTDTEKNVFEKRQKYDRYVQHAIYDAYLKSDDKDQRILMKQFGEWLGKGRGAIYQGLFEKEGVKNPLVLAEFAKFLREKNHTFMQQLKSFKEFSIETMAEIE